MKGRFHVRKTIKVHKHKLPVTLLQTNKFALAMERAEAIGGSVYDSKTLEVFTPPSTRKPSMEVPA